MIARIAEKKTADHADERRYEIAVALESDPQNTQKNTEPPAESEQPVILSEAPPRR
jgi:hypothetical protein